MIFISNDNDVVWKQLILAAMLKRLHTRKLCIKKTLDITFEFAKSSWSKGVKMLPWKKGSLSSTCKVLLILCSWLDRHTEFQINYRNNILKTNFFAPERITDMMSVSLRNWPKLVCPLVLQKIQKPGFVLL